MPCVLCYILCKLICCIIFGVSCTCTSMCRGWYQKNMHGFVLVRECFKIKFWIIGAYIHDDRHGYNAVTECFIIIVPGVHVVTSLGYLMKLSPMVMRTQNGNSFYPQNWHWCDHMWLLYILECFLFFIYSLKNMFLFYTWVYLNLVLGVPTCNTLQPTIVCSFQDQERYIRMIGSWQCHKVGSHTYVHTSERSPAWYESLPANFLFEHDVLQSHSNRWNCSQREFPAKIFRAFFCFHW